MNIPHNLEFYNNYSKDGVLLSDMNSQQSKEAVVGETIRTYFTTPLGERMLKIATKDKVRYVKLGHVDDAIWDEPAIQG